MNRLNISFHPISSAGGVEVRGVDLHKELSKADQILIKDECRKHSFLLFRNQQITLADQIRFGEIFGGLLDAEASNNSEGSFVTSQGEICMHFDHWLISNYPQPLQYTMLYALDVTPSGGETIFANVSRAYENLPGLLKTRIVGMEALHCYDYSYSNGKILPKRIREAEIPDDQPRALHMVARVHPNTNRQTVYISPRNTDRIIGIDVKESETIIQLLLEYITEPENIYEHKWRKDDLIVWDNNALLHGRKDYDPKYKRRLRRICIL